MNTAIQGNLSNIFKNNKKIEMLLTSMLTKWIKVKDSLTPEDGLCLMKKATGPWVEASSWVVA